MTKNQIQKIATEAVKIGQQALTGGSNGWGQESVARVAATIIKEALRDPNIQRALLEE